MRCPRGGTALCLLLGLGLLILMTGCQSAAAASDSGLVEQPLRFEGQGAAEIALEAWQGPAVLHINAQAGGELFRVAAAGGLDQRELLRSEAAEDEYRGIVVGAGEPPHLIIEGDRAWKIEVLPLHSAVFDQVSVPVSYSGNGSRVLRLNGAHSIANFDTGADAHFAAWAVGETGQWERLKITPDGDYKGNSVLPRKTTTIIVSASGAWSVEILEPCCEANPNNK